MYPDKLGDWVKVCPSIPIVASGYTIKTNDKKKNKHRQNELTLLLVPTRQGLV